ncbi:hypothetical protein EAL2_808p07650 (plasmid) [Peptoclostridium acidaminophilum DSM 3953]|uniref:Flagellar Assembly Protein A N-terminal region domain-containing protein n=1 Tax=Peptoclostridium acidaminophilum DSM 3953 TaxID=1286171 RepID=W8TKL0_PEPAC|nr:FapA family protein [Peptoclostridium acidaminophilum]AHM58268.1 hypothetical protein EAL2_808p07650 [Peptoclostridium acidaminophilum DSM 3953]
MIVKAQSEEEARLFVKNAYGRVDSEFRLKVVKEPYSNFLGFIKRKGLYKIEVEKVQIETQENTHLQNWEKYYGYAEIINGNVKVTIPGGIRKYPSLKADDPNIDVFVNGEKIVGSIILTENDKIELKPKVIDPVTRLEVDISDDGMEATLKIHKEKGKKFYIKDSAGENNLVICSDFEEIEAEKATIDHCIRILNDSRIKLDIIDIEAVNKLIDLPDGGSIVVARGKAPCDGINAEIQYFFEESDFENEKPVQIGDVLAFKLRPSLNAKNGISVTGELTHGNEPEEQSFSVGKGAVLLENDTKIVACTDGTPRIIDGKICVVPLLVIASDVDSNTGNIKFDGDLLIKGNVMDNMEVNAKGKIKTLGSVYNSKVISDRDITICGKVIGGKLVAGKNMANHLISVSVVEDSLVVINDIIKRVDLFIKKDISMAARVVYSEQEAILKYIKKIEKVLSEMDEDDKDTSFTMLCNIKNCLLEISELNTKNIDKLKVIYKKIVQYIDNMQSMYEARIELQYAQNSNIYSSGNITVIGDGSYQSNLIAKYNILYNNPKSSVKGGMLIAGKRICAGKIGSKIGMSTYCRILDKYGKVDGHYYNGTIINIHGNIRMFE